MPRLLLAVMVLAQDRALGVLTLLNGDGARPAEQEDMAPLPLPDPDLAEIARVLTGPGPAGGPAGWAYNVVLIVYVYVYFRTGSPFGGQDLRHRSGAPKVA